MGRPLYIQHPDPSQGYLSRQAPDFLYEYARALAGSRDGLARIDDDLLLRTAEFLTFCNDKTTRSGRIIMDCYWDIHGAQMLRDGEDSNEQSAIIECGVLSGAQPEDIADELALPLEVVEAYEHLFFNIRENLGKKAYITSRVLSDTISQLQLRSSGKEVPVAKVGVWKYMAYHMEWGEFLELYYTPVFSEKGQDVLRGLMQKNELIKVCGAVLLETPSMVSSGEILERSMRAPNMAKKISEEEEGGGTEWRRQMREITEGVDIRPAGSGGAREFKRETVPLRMLPKGEGQ